MTAAIINAQGLVVGYGGRPVLENVNFELRANEVVCLIGHNGAGKSTLLNAIFGLIPIQGGEIFLSGKRQERLDQRTLMLNGFSLVPEGRGVFPGLTVQETLKMGMWAAGVPKTMRQDRLDWVLTVLPALKTFYKKRAGTLSGGQQQIVSIARALLSQPRCLLMDEPSIGLAPKLFQDLLYPIKELQVSTGMSILLVEQNVREALKISDRVVVMKAGAIIQESKPEELADNEKLMELY